MWRKVIIFREITNLKELVTCMDKRTQKRTIFLNESILFIRFGLEEKLTRNAREMFEYKLR